MIGSMLSRFAEGQACKLEPAMMKIIPTWYKYLQGEIDEVSGKCRVANFSIDSIGAVLLALFEIILYVGGIVAVAYVIYGGFQYIISQGEPDRLKSARGTILNAVIGLAISISAIAIVNLIGHTITT
jgi:hypothetical protein